MFPLIGIGPIIAITTGYFFRRRNWASSLELIGLFVLGIQILSTGNIFVIAYLEAYGITSIPSSYLPSSLFVFPIIGVIIGLVKMDKYWATLLKQVSLSCVLVVVFVLTFFNLESNPTQNARIHTIFAYILIGGPVVFISLCLYRHSLKRYWGVVISGIILLIFVIFVVSILFPGFEEARYKSRCAEVKSNTHKIQRAVERYCTDAGGNYPENIQVLLDIGYLSELPGNPLTGKPMQDVEFGSDNCPGNFTYLTHLVDGNVNGYYLFCYGANEEPALDVNQDGVFDHVIMVLLDSYPGSGPRRPTLSYGENPNSEEHDKQIEEIPVRKYYLLPELKDLLKETYNDD